MKCIRFTLGSDDSRCPPSNDLKIGGYHCKNDKCINDNKSYLDMKTAWAACKTISGCKYIMQWTDGKFQLRKSDDIYDPNPVLLYVEFNCPGNMKLVTYSFPLNFLFTV